MCNVTVLVKCVSYLISKSTVRPTGVGRLDAEAREVRLSFIKRDHTKSVIAQRPWKQIKRQRHLKERRKDFYIFWVLPLCQESVSWPWHTWLYLIPEAGCFSRQPLDLPFTSYVTEASCFVSPHFHFHTHKIGTILSSTHTQAFEPVNCE